MTDTGRNGWGYTFGLLQNGTNQVNFTLISGSSGTLTITVLDSMTADIVVVAASASKKSS